MKAKFNSKKYLGDIRLPNGRLVKETKLKDKSVGELLPSVIANFADALIKKNDKITEQARVLKETTGKYNTYCELYGKAKTDIVKLTERNKFADIALNDASSDLYKLRITKNRKPIFWIIATIALAILNVIILTY